MSWRAYLRHELWPRLKRLVALIWQRLSAAFILAACFYMALAVLGFDAQDASLNTSSGATPQNWLGRPGAFLADMAMQLMGLAVWLVLLPVAARAARQFIGRQLPHPNWRFIAAVSAPLFFALGLALGGREASPYEPFPGGAVGQLLADALEAIFAAATYYPTREVELSLAALFALIGLMAGLYAAGLVRAGWVGLSKIARFAVSLPQKMPQKIGSLRTAAPLSALSEDDKSPLALRLRVATLAQHLSSWRARFARGPAPEVEPQAANNDAPFAGEINSDAANAPSTMSTPSTPSVEVTTPKAKPKPSRRAKAEAQPSLAFDNDGGAHKLPPLTLLDEYKPQKPAMTLSKDALEANARMLETVLADFGIKGTIGKVRPGPVVTLYELEPAAGVRSSRVVGLADDIARSMSAVSARVAPVPGANVIGIELPNQSRELVSLRELLSAAEFESPKNKLAMALGKDIGGAPVMADLARMPHLLVAGTTGSGKSVGINTMILSLLYRLTPEQCRLILVDPKMLELSVYDGIPHLLAPVVTEPKKAVVALKWVVQEMENRYRKMAKIGVRNIDGFNERMREAQKTGETLTRRVQTGFDPETGEAIFEEENIQPEVLPFIVVVIDEMADLMMVAGKDIEAAVQRLAQMARAAGVHLITATQRPSVDVITGTIKANFPSRISFQVTSKIDSRTVLGEQGAEQLLGQGDMLYMGVGSRVQRVHGPFVSDEEVEKVVTFLKSQGAPHYIEQVTAEPEESPDLGEPSGDNLYDQAVAIVTRDGRASTSYVQRRLQIGYNRAARLIEQMEEQGVISPPNHAGKREILVGKH